MISNRAKKLTSSTNFMYAGWKKHHDDPYNADTNPTGMINCGVSENKLIGDEILEKLSSISMKTMDESLTHYCPLTGTEDFRGKLSRFFTKFMKPSIDIKADNVVVMNGCGTVVETLGAAICDDGEGFLVPAPYYTSFKSDLEARFNTKLCPIKLSAQDCDGPFTLTLAKLQNSFNEALESGTRIRGLLLSNPINPLGITYSVEELEMCLEFCYENEIHLVCDEIYMLSVYEHQSTFTNLLSLKNIGKYKDLVHIVWGFSKDFALSGFRCGVAITFNDDMKRALLSTAYYTSVPTSTQYVLGSLIEDHEWVKNLQQINHKRLKNARDTVAGAFNDAHIPYLVPNSGLFLAFSVLPYMKKETFEEEMKIYQTFLDNGIFLIPGKVLEFTEPGWFRIIISNEMTSLTTGVSRIVESLQKYMNIGCYDAA